VVHKRSMPQAIYKLLEIPAVYNAVQNILGGPRIFATMRQAVEAQLATLTYQNVLDVGCGTGIAVEWFSGAYYGMDLNPQYFRKIPRAPQRSFQVGDATALPFQSESFDVVFTLGVLHHLDANNCQNMLGEMARVCKPGGTIIIIDGLVPSNRLNIIGYLLAKFDRGRYKVRIEQFQAMLAQAFPTGMSLSSQVSAIFPGEYVLSVLTKSQ
jgi:ubiquinone/menaquinone biosynthesis C-methylase UbiE